MIGFDDDLAAARDRETRAGSRSRFKRVQCGLDPACAVANSADRGAEKPPAKGTRHRIERSKLEPHIVPVPARQLSFESRGHLIERSRIGAEVLGTSRNRPNGALTPFVLDKRKESGADANTFVTRVLVSGIVVIREVNLIAVSARLGAPEFD
jgi:hypothetical protein